MTFVEKSLQILELPAILEMLAREAASDGAKEEALSLRPSGDLYVTELRLKETGSAKKMMVLNGSPPFAGVKDIGSSLARAQAGGCLNTTELLNAAGVMRAARETAAYAAADKGQPGPLGRLFSALRGNRPLEERITNSIIGEDELADSASPQLAAIRRKMRMAGDKIRTTLQRLISSPTYQKALQEPIITMRGGRYVVPVKAEFRSAVQGLIHDVSATGATIFVEPMGAVEANNEIRELLSQEKNEIDRILMELTSLVADLAEPLRVNIATLIQLDLIFAKAKLSFQMDAAEPELSSEGELVLRRARHPLLNKATAVPIDVRLGGDYDTLIVTGPNTGGKTVSLKTIGLLSAMTQCGLHIPAADGSRVPVFKQIMADIGDEQSIEQSLSTFSSHMSNIRYILDSCGEGSLILFDELGAGTDPVEGAALATSIIEYARKSGALIAATTHYAELKVYATTQPGVQNASCEFDVETLRPTYRLIVGIPGKSNAFAIAQRIGLPPSVVEDARSRVDTESVEFEQVIESLERTRQALEREHEEAALLRRRAQEDADAAGKLRRESEEEREKITRTARREATELINTARRAADDAFEEIKAIRKKQIKGEDWQKTNEARAALRHSLNEAEEKVSGGRGEEAAPPPMLREAKAGDTVTVLSLGTTATVLSVNADGTLQLQAGIFKMSAKQDEVRVTENQAAKKPKIAKNSEVRGPAAAGVAPQIDIRGMMVDEGLLVVERYIDSAVMAKLNTVTIIHGKGTGALRKAVQEALKLNKQVKSYRMGRYGEGEMGVTVVELR